MVDLEKLIAYIEYCEKDDRLKMTHVSFIMALIFCWIKSGQQNSFKITRRLIMNIARIRSTATYHRCVEDLSEFGYFEYEPSFNPQKATTVTIKLQEK